MSDLRTTSGTLALGTLVALLGLGVGLETTPGDGEEGTVQEAQVYRGSLQPVDDSGVQGEVVVQRTGEELSVRVNARGLASGSHPQHIHDGESCADFGGVAVPLDSDLGSMSDGSFPSTEGESASLTYNQEGTHPDFADLPLADQTVVLHASGGAPVACAALDKRGK